MSGLLGGLFAVAAAGLPSSSKGDNFQLRPFHIDLSQNVPRMLDLVRDYQLPKKPEYPGVGASKGIDLDVLKGLRKQWLTKFDWKKEQDTLNK